MKTIFEELIHAKLSLMPDILVQYRGDPFKGTEDVRMEYHNKRMVEYVFLPADAMIIHSTPIDTTAVQPPGSFKKPRLNTNEAVIDAIYLNNVSKLGVFNQTKNEESTSFYSIQQCVTKLALHLQRHYGVDKISEYKMTFVYSAKRITGYTEAAAVAMRDANPYINIVILERRVIRDTAVNHENLTEGKVWYMPFDHYSQRETFACMFENTRIGNDYQKWLKRFYLMADEHNAGWTPYALQGLPSRRLVPSVPTAATLAPTTATLAPTTAETTATTLAPADLLPLRKNHDNRHFIKGAGVQCTNCIKWFSKTYVEKNYEDNFASVLADPHWPCYCCRGLCCLDDCVRRRENGKTATEVMKHMGWVGNRSRTYLRHLKADAVAAGFPSIWQLLHATGDARAW